MDPAVPLYPSTGNHDTWPVNVEDWTSPGSNDSINQYAQNWVDWIGEEAAAEFTKWGYCTVPFKLANGKVLENSKIIILNTQAANTTNFYNAGFKNDPADHIAWLEAQLKEIEEAGGLAYIIGHIQPYNFSL